MRTRLLALPMGAALLAMFLLLPDAASAHEHREVGNYHFTVGFLNEPPIVDQMNGISLTITDGANNKPVTDADKNLKAEVVVGGNAKSMPLVLAPRAGVPGGYAANFIPTASGSYIFHFTGTLNGDPIDQRFESGPGRFDDVQPASSLEFPQKLSDSADLQAQVAQAQSAVGQARLLGIAGLVVGLIAIAVGARSLAAGKPRG